MVDKESARADLFSVGTSCQGGKEGGSSRARKRLPLPAAKQRNVLFTKLSPLSPIKVPRYGTYDTVVRWAVIQELRILTTVDRIPSCGNVTVQPL